MLTVRNGAIAIISASVIVLAAVAYIHVVTVAALRQFGETSYLYIDILPYFIPTICLALVGCRLLRKQRNIASALCGVVAFAWSAVLWISQTSGALG